MSFLQNPRDKMKKDYGFRIKRPRGMNFVLIHEVSTLNQGEPEMNDNFFDHLDEFDAHLLLKKGVRLLDQLAIRPVQGRKREMRLDRMSYIFESTSGYQLMKTGDKILLPACGHPGFGFLLRLVSSRTSYESETFRYRLESTGQRPFMLNGSWCFKAYLQRGDNIQLGHNRLKFCAEVPASCGEETDGGAESDMDSETIAHSDMVVLIEGETGTGKTRLARMIHEKSGRMGNFIHINPSSFAAGLVESELFGHVKGSFTGALTSKRGAILEAHKGTLFLDEIDSLPLDVQTKLLLFLESKRIRPVGGEGEVEADVRIILASGRTLSSLVEKGGMRRDFYFRVAAGFKLILKPLRLRPDLVRRLCLEFCDTRDLDLSEQLIEFYQKESWPGNVRQLLAHLEKKRLFVRGRKLAFDKLDEELIADSGSIAIQNPVEEFMTLDSIKRQYVQKVFGQCRSNLSLSARVLGITENTMRSYLGRPKTG